MDNRQFWLLKAATPDSYTFIMEASREVPRRMMHPKRSPIGLRVPEHRIVAALLGEHFLLWRIGRRTATALPSNPHEY